MKFLKIKDWPTNLKGVVVVGGIFILSRLLLAGLGVSFNLEYLEKGWQFIDPALLKNQLWSSLWYLHSQPPLFNLFSGLVLQLFPVHFSLVFHWFFVMAGLALTVFLFLIMRKLKINWWLAVVITLLFVLSPTIILFENFFFYDYLVLVILLISVFFLQQYLEKNKSGYLFTFFLILSLLTLLRSLFHLVWFLVIFLVLLYFYRRNWKKVILASLIPFLLIIGWYGKNLYLFGNFGASSWMGMGLYKTTMFLTTEAERQTLFKEGITSGYFPMDPFTINLANIKIPNFNRPELLSQPVIGQLVKSNGYINFNYYGYLALAKQLMGDVRSVILHQPAVYLKSVVGTAVIFFSPGSSHFSSQQNPPYNNYAILQNWDKFYGLFVYGEPLAWGGQKLLNYVSTAANIRPTQAWRFLVIGLFLTIIYLLGLVYGLIVVCRRKFFIKPDLPHDLIVGFLLFNIIYVTAIGILVEAGENQRHHLMIESFGWILLALILQKFVFDKRKIKS